MAQDDRQDWKNARGKKREFKSKKDYQAFLRSQALKGKSVRADGKWYDADLSSKITKQALAGYKL